MKKKTNNRCNLQHAHTCRHIRENIGRLCHTACITLWFAVRRLESRREESNKTKPCLINLDTKCHIRLIYFCMNNLVMFSLI
jgi:hypothetical protein